MSKSVSTTGTEPIYKAVFKVESESLLGIVAQVPSQLTIDKMNIPLVNIKVKKD